MPRFDRRPDVRTGLPSTLAGAAGLALAGLLLAAATASVDPQADGVVTGLAAPVATASATESIPAAAAAEPLLPDAGTAPETVAVPTADQTLAAESAAAEPAAPPAAAEPAASAQDDVSLGDPEPRPAAGDVAAEALPPAPAADAEDPPTEGEDAQAARKSPLARTLRPRPPPAVTGPAAARADAPRPARRAVLLGRPAPALFLPRPEPLTLPALPRLAPSFAARLVRIARAAGVDWELVLAVLRARGHTGPRPATVRLRTLAATLAAREQGVTRRGTALAAPGELVRALVCLHRAVGLGALVRGLTPVRERLTARLLHDRRVWIYSGGRDDLRAGAVDVRVVAVLLYLAEQHGQHGQITVSSLRTGHRIFARPGVVSAHALGRAVDIAAVAGRRIAGALRANGRVERLVRSLLLLPRELRPREVISLLALGGPSFALADHGDHVHVGY